jgi:hypothetical protein
VHHHQHPPATASAPGHPSYPGTAFGYPYLPLPPSGYPGYPPHPPQPPPTTTNVTAEENTAEEGGIAWEAAQNILKAINFGGLLQLPTEDNETADKANNPAPGMDVTESRAAPLLAISSTTGEATGVKAADSDPSGQNTRAGLQAQLALLAAQLAEIAQARDPGGAQLMAGKDIEVDQVGYVDRV